MFVNEYDLDEGTSNKSLVVETANTYIIVDWDDTLLPTSWLTKNDLRLDTYLIPDSVKEELRKVDQAAVDFLRKASVLYGKVLIITNAQPHWIELSSQKFLPETHQLLFTLANDDSDVSVCSFSSSSSGFRNQDVKLSTPDKDLVRNTMEVKETFDDCKIKIFSARELFEKDFPNNPSAWKKMTFKKLLKSRIASKFFIDNSETDKIIKYLSDSEMVVEDEEPNKRGLKRSFSSISLSTSDFNGFVELESESYEIETEFKDTDSFFSLDLGVPVESNPVEIEWENQGTGIPGVGLGTPSKSEPLKECCNLISIGDCTHDCESLSKLDIGLDSDVTLLKTVKFVDFPTIRELYLEIDGLNIFLDTLITRKQTCDLIVDRKKLL